MKHTEGPWFVGGDYPGGTSVEGDTGEPSNIVCMCNGSARQANAALIAAAPQLYGALQNIVRHVKANDPGYAASAWFVDAEAALAKAEGR